MKRAGKVFGRAAVALGALSLSLTVAACDEEGKTAPERCADDRITETEAGNAGEATGLRPCFTPVGHAVSSFGGEPGTAGTSAGGGSSNGGSGGSTAVGESGAAGTSSAGAGGS